MVFNDLKASFDDWLDKNEDIRKLWSRIDEKLADYKDATNYSMLVGKEWSSLLQTAAASDLSEDELLEIIDDGLKQGYRSTSYYAKRVQQVINSRYDISMKSFEPAIDESRLENLKAKLKETANIAGLITNENEWLIGEDVVESVARSAITDTIQYNARMQSEAGLNAYITRDAGAGCCSWCNGLVGVYVYGDEPEDFYRVHKGCTCTITYRPSKTKLERMTFYQDTDGKLRRRIERF